MKDAVTFGYREISTKNQKYVQAVKAPTGTPRNEKQKKREIPKVFFLQEKRYYD